MRRVLIATSNRGKLRDFSGAAAAHGITIASLPDFEALPGVREDGASFEENARKKAEHYSRFAPGEIVLADDSGLEVDALGGMPGIFSARYAFIGSGVVPDRRDADPLNNGLLLSALEGVPAANRTARFVCVIAAARDRQTLASFRGEARGCILEMPRGSGGFGYDPLFFFPALGKTFAELTPEEKAGVSHRGAAFRKFLKWYEREAAQR
ncbi:MAG TPA: RdgB/HAM1 family non-canonical purine NTP pyrophosphatase [Terriglobales bacterium]|jgi:XTP/dITP diphosphohydrolase|nr:RdgB/HAM1 family non-canonical purine NTP pyrophosphatase [Terriglobales bacterium]